MRSVSCLVLLSVVSLAAGQSAAECTKQFRDVFTTSCTENEMNTVFNVVADGIVKSPCNVSEGLKNGKSKLTSGCLLRNLGKLVVPLGKYNTAVKNCKSDTKVVNGKLTTILTEFADGIAKQVEKDTCAKKGQSADVIKTTAFTSIKKYFNAAATKAMVKKVMDALNACEYKAGHDFCNVFSLVAKYYSNKKI